MSTKRPNPVRKAKTGAPNAKLNRRSVDDRTLAGSTDRGTIAADERSTRPGDAALAPDDRIVTSNLTMHQLFEQQTARMLQHADLTEEQKQNLLIGMSCPCCGAGSFSFRAKLRRG